MKTQEELIIECISKTEHIKLVKETIETTLYTHARSVLEVAQIDRQNLGYYKVSDIILHIKSVPGMPVTYPNFIIIKEIRNVVDEMRDNGFDISIINQNSEIVYRIEGKRIEQILRRHYANEGTDSGSESN